MTKVIENEKERTNEKQERKVMKYFNVIFWSMLVIAGILMFTATDRLENRLETMENRIDEISTKLKDMTNE